MEWGGFGLSRLQNGDNPGRLSGQENRRALQNRERDSINSVKGVRRNSGIPKLEQAGLSRLGFDLNLWNFEKMDGMRVMGTQLDQADRTFERTFVTDSTI